MKAPSSNRRPTRTRAKSPDRNVRRVTVLGEASIELGVHTLEGFPDKNLAELLERHGLAYQDTAAKTPFAELYFSSETPQNLIVYLAEVFPNLERVTIRRKESSYYGGGYSIKSIWLVSWDQKAGCWSLEARSPSSRQ